MSDDDIEIDMAAGSLPARLLRLALPLSLGSVVRYAVELLNTYWVGKLGVASLAVVTALGTFLSLSKMFAGLTSAGTSAVVGRMVGESRRRAALRVAQKVCVAGLLLGGVVAVVAWLVRGPAFVALHLSGESHRAATLYLDALLLGLPLSFASMTASAVLVGLGRSGAAMRAQVAALVVAAIVTPVLLRLAHVGVWGAAVGHVAGDLAGTLVAIAKLREIAKSGDRVLSLPELFSGFRELLPVLRIGAPLTFDAVIHGTVWFALVAFLANYGAEFVAAHAAEERFTEILNLPAEGLAPATATLVGYHIGRGERSEALRTVWLSLAFVVGIGVFGALIFRTMPASIVAWLCEDASFVDVGLRVLAIAAFGIVFLAGRDVMESAYGGVGAPAAPVVIGLVVTIARFPVAYLMAVKWQLGGFGVNWAVNATLAFQAIVLVIWFRARFVRYGLPEEPKAQPSQAPRPVG